MNEKDRLRELREYHILDTFPEKEFDELAEIASAICDTPISLVSFIDETRQWAKAKKGIDLIEIPRKDSFCQHALQNPKEILIVDDPTNDERFKDNPFVMGSPHIRFYAGAPLETPQGNVLGTLCILDSKPRTLTESQQKALKLLAKKAMDYLEIRRLLIDQDDQIELSASRLKKISNQAPGAIYQLEMDPVGKMSFSFISEGISELYPDLKPHQLIINPEIAFNLIHPEDLAFVRESIKRSYSNLSNWNIEYRVISNDGNILWHWANAKPERREDGTVIWYGSFQNITERKEYIKTLEQILFDISHVMRKPVATMLGLTETIENDSLDEETLKQLARHIKVVSKEMDNYIRELNDAYSEIKSKVTGVKKPITAL